MYAPRHKYIFHFHVKNKFENEYTLSTHAQWRLRRRLRLSVESPRLMNNVLNVLVRGVQREKYLKALLAHMFPGVRL